MYNIERKDDAISKCYDIHKNEMSMDKDKFLELVGEQDSIAITYNGETVGGVWFQNGVFMHLAVEEGHRGRWAFNIWPDILNYIEEVYDGEMLAPVRKENKETISLMIRAGFTHVKNDKDFSWWKI